MKSAAAVIAMTFLTVGSLLAQVHIRESAVITPEQVKKVQDGATKNHTMRFEFHWDGAPKGRVECTAQWPHSIGQCPVEYTTEESGNFFILNFPSPSAQAYTFTMYLWDRDCSENALGRFSCQVYCDGVFAGSDSGIVRLFDSWYYGGLD
ncbi:MAG TPA: hypothetical protein VLX91_09435 [Candidatus Acidoferrales bacterium]|nr:hypothetical protein [Candidatus Acidoferrales bacterium]